MIIAQKSMSFVEFAELKKDIVLDRSFNVGSAESGRWDETKQLNYVLNIPSGQAGANPITICDIESSLSSSLPGFGDYDYFNTMSKEGKFIATDGNNRSRAIYNFFKGVLKLSSFNEYWLTDVDGSKIKWSPQPDELTYPDFPEHVKSFFDRSINVNILMNASRVDLSDTFKAMNSGIALNSAELRNANLSTVNKIIQQIGIDFENSVGRFFYSTREITRCGYDMGNAIWLYYHINQHSLKSSITDGPLDKMYAEDSVGDSTLVEFNSMARKFLSMFAENQDIIPPGFKHHDYFNACIVFSYMHGQNIKVINKKAFVQWLCDTLMELRYKQCITKVDNHGNEMHVGLKELSSRNRENIELKTPVLIGELHTSGLFEDNSITHIDSSRIATDAERYKLWQRQNHRCAITGELIEPRHILNASRYQVDHIKEHALGGGRGEDLDNFQLITVSAHKEKTRNFMKEFSNV